MPVLWCCDVAVASAAVALRVAVLLRVRLCCIWRCDVAVRVALASAAVAVRVAVLRIFLR